MKKVKIILTIALGIVVGGVGYAQSNKAGFQKTSRTSELGLKGEVKSFKVTPYKVNEVFGEVEKAGKMDYWRGDVISIFDKQGLKIQSDRYDRAGQLQQRIFYKYNSAGNRTSRDTYNSAGRIVLRQVYVYNEKGFPTAFNGYDPVSGLVESFSYKTDEKGRIIEETCVKTTHPNCLNYKLTYDKDGKVLTNCSEGKHEKDNVCEKYTYDKQGRIIQIELLKQGTLNKKTIITYDERGNEANIKNFDGNSNFQDERECSYKYDEKGNWIQRVEYVNKFPRLLIEREIEYY